MALQPCRAGLVRSRSALRAGSLRACYATAPPTTTDSTPTPESFKIPSQQPTKPAPPRWSYTPEGMKARVQMDHAKNPRNKVWSVNSNPKLLDDMYNQLLGPGGSKLLPEELKWLAVTHKSFDQGRRGFNDRLALLGRYTLVMETTKDIISRKPMEGSQVADEFEGERQPFLHEQLQQVDNLNAELPRDIVSKTKIHDLGLRVGLLNVLRWKPRLPEKLEASGLEVVMNGAILAIVGAVTLQHGSVVASKIVRERILSKLSD